MAAARVVIAGGGISGLSLAYFLGQAGIGSILLEKAGRLGGLIQTHVADGCVLEAGPDSYLAAKPAVTELAQELPGLEDELIGSNDAHRRIFVVREGDLTPFPQGMAMMVPVRWRPALESRLFGFKTKLGFLAETLRRPLERSEDVSVKQFVTEHFGGEVFRYVAEPLLSGVYGGDAAQLSAGSVLPRFLGYEREYGSLIRGARRDQGKQPRKSLFLSFRSGMQALTDSLAGAIGNYTRVVRERASSIERRGNLWRVHAGGDSIETESVALACPAGEAAKIVRSAAHLLSEELNGIRYASAILVNLVYRRVDVERAFDGFGFLLPREERRTIAAATYASTKFAERTPADKSATRAFIVEPEAKQLLKASSDEVISLVRADLKRLLGVDAVPAWSSVHRWPSSMPQYEVGHGQRCERISAELEAFAGLYLTGSAYQGVGIPDCVRLAKETAKRIAADCKGCSAVSE